MAMLPQRYGAAVQINVTPLIDVLLVLLIIFMTISPLMPRGLNASVPQDGPNSEVPTAPIVLEVRSDGTVAINSQTTTESGVVARLRQVFAGRRTRTPLYLKAAPDLEFERVARLIDAAHEAGIVDVALMSANETR